MNKSLFFQMNRAAELDLVIKAHDLFVKVQDADIRASLKLVMCQVLRNMVEAKPLAAAAAVFGMRDFQAANAPNPRDFQGQLFTENQRGVRTVEE